MHPNELEEIQIQHQLNDCVNAFQSFRFNAGAGAGKTYALIETIKHVVTNKLLELEKKSQNVICITYTNVAVREIKDRLGRSEIVLVSTIHDRLWSLIKPYQHELVKLHLDKVKHELQQLSLDFSGTSNKSFAKYNALSDDKKAEFKDFAIKNQRIYFLNRDANAAPFKAAYKDVMDKPDFFDDLISGTQNFKETVKRIYKIERYQKCIIDIESNKHPKVEYDSGFNSDRLEYMKFSHDTLLEYAYKLFERYPMLQRIVIDKYPYFFIDEYQDTDEKVIKIVKKLYDAAKNLRKKWLVGYFGDTAQNIYDDGVGLGIKTIHPEVTEVYKKFNRRSHKQIIHAINAIRNDEIVQKPIFEQRDGGRVEFYFSTDNADKKYICENFLAKYRNDLLNDGSLTTNPIHCLVLTNKLVADPSQFSDIHRVVSDSNVYYKDLNTKLLSSDLEKLHPTLLLLYRITKLRKIVSDEHSAYSDALGRIKGNTSFSDVHGFFEKLKLIKSSTLGEFVSVLSKEIGCIKRENNLRMNLLKNLSVNLNESEYDQDLETYTFSKVKELMLKPGSSSSESNTESKEVNTLLEIGLDQWHRWANFIDRENTGEDIIYHTYHGTKGEEYENVAVIMEHNFGRSWEGKDKIKNYFLKVESFKKKTTEPEKQDVLDTDFESSKNLLYVACSRAMKNLRILYIDDIKDIRTGIESIFGSISEWKSINN